MPNAPELSQHLQHVVEKTRSPEEVRQVYGLVAQYLLSEDQIGGMTRAERTNFKIIFPSDPTSRKRRFLDSSLNGDAGRFGMPVYFVEPAIAEKSYQNYFGETFARGIAAAKAATTLKLEAGTVEQRFAELSEKLEPLKEPTHRQTYADLLAIIEAILANDVLLLGKSRTTGKLEKPGHKIDARIDNKDGAYQAMWRWLTDLDGTPFDEIAYSFGIAGVNPVTNKGVSHEEFYRLKLLDQPEKLRQILRGIVYGVKGERGGPISDEVKSQILRVYQEMRINSRTDQNFEDPSGFNPATGVDLSKMRKVNAGLVFDCPIAYRLLLEEINGIPQTDKHAFESALGNLTHAIRGEAISYPFILRALLQTSLNQSDLVQPASPEFLAEMQTANQKYSKTHPSEGPLVQTEWTFLRPDAAAVNNFSPEYTEALQLLHQVRQNRLAG